MENLKGSEHYIPILYEDLYGYVYEVHTYLMQSISFFGIVLLKYSLFQVFFATSPPVPPLCFTLVGGVCLIVAQSP